MEDTQSGRYSQSVPRPVGQERGSGHGHATVLNHGLVVITALSLEKAAKHLSVT